MYSAYFAAFLMVIVLIIMSVDLGMMLQRYHHRKGPRKIYRIRRIKNNG
jgi:hypothetical protein